MEDQNPFLQSTTQESQQTQDSNPFIQISKNVANAQKYIGQPIDQGYCETFVEQMSGLPNMGGTAAEAWNNFAQQGKANPDISQASEGSLIYFQPDQSNGDAGHVGIADGKGGMISATYKGVQHTGINDLGQKPLGFVTP